jgi:16S rRNA C1402 N4-methylase RsmH
MAHESVLLKEAIDGLDLHIGDVYLDATLGGVHVKNI